MSQTMRATSQSQSLTPNRAQTAGSLLTDTNSSRYQKDRRLTIEASTTVKPKVLESKVATRDNFFTLSDGFKRVFSNDTRDQKMVVPVVGYGGHRRGEQSQNFFGKSFRDATIQSKFLERQFRNRNA